ncbi:MAG TPA: putative zinc-binding metallopeptidase, partial [Geminicoccus sp.]|uniref:putative zinc-binding metallopeptidase n=1 Tax=Geminicoccus sp. TaxID=2024832 RepID=UPI002CE88E2F
YATTHPWEDFAETWTHYLHIVDTLETAAAFGLKVDPKAGDDDLLSAEMDDVKATRARHVQELIDAWLPLTFAVNSLNRSMGQPDLYPFVLSPAVIEKLGFIHDLVQRKI